MFSNSLEQFVTLVHTGIVIIKKVFIKVHFNNIGVIYTKDKHNYLVKYIVTLPNANTRFLR